MDKYRVEVRISEAKDGAVQVYGQTIQDQINRAERLDRALKTLLDGDQVCVQ